MCNDLHGLSIVLGFLCMFSRSCRDLSVTVQCIGWQDSYRNDLAIGICVVSEELAVMYFDGIDSSFDVKDDCAMSLAGDQLGS